MSPRENKRISCLPPSSPPPTYPAAFNPVQQEQISNLAAGLKRPNQVDIQAKHGQVRQEAWCWEDTEKSRPLE